MIGSFVTRGLVMLLGYTYPAYECFKIVEENKPEIEQLRFWCRYWIIGAFLTAFERIGDAFVSWLPMYGEAKLAFFIYLWCPKTKVARHETEIDRNLLELRTRAGDMAVMYCQKAAKDGHTQVFEILQYVASRSSGSRTNQKQPQQAQPQPQQVQSNPPYVRPSKVAAAARQPVSKQQQPQHEPPPLRQTSSVASLRREIAQETNQPAQQSSAQPQKEEPPSQLQPSTALQALPPSPQRSSSGQALPPPQRTASRKSISDTREASSQVSRPPSPPSDVEITEAEATSAETVPASENGVEKAPGAEDVVMEDSIRVTRARLRKTRVMK